MAKEKQEDTSTKSDVRLANEEPRSLALAERGVKTGTDFANMMSALMSDIISSRITPQVANACTNAGSKLLKIVEMQYKYGGKGNQNLILTLAPGESQGEASVN